MNLKEIIREEISRFLVREIVESDMILYHGSQHDFIKFQTKNIGTGEGNQSFGYGLYFTSNRDVAEFYANALKDKVGYVYTARVKGGDFFDWYERLDEAFKSKFIEKMHEMGYKKIPYKRKLEAGRINTYYLSLEEAVNYFPNGKFFYENLSLLFGSEAKASNFLYKLGFMGIKYPIGSSLKNAISDLHGFNYVIFNDNVVEIIKKDIV